MAGPAACGTLQFTIVNSTTATVAWPSGSCGSGLVLIKAANPTWNGTTRILTLQVRVKNTSGQTVNRPIRVALPDTGRTVTAPSGQPSTKITANTPDSLYSSGTGVWFAGTIGTLTSGDSTATKQIKIKAASPVTGGQLRFLIATDEVIVGMSASAPKVRPVWFNHDSSYTSGTDAPTLKRALVVTYVAGATVQQKQAAIDSIQGTVIGGAPWEGAADQGMYFVGVPTATTIAALQAAVTILSRQPVVRLASLILASVPHGARPDDGPGWQRADWIFNPDSSSGNNWAFEDVALPLAWGCETGTSQVRVGIVDQTFKAGGFVQNLVNPLPILDGDTSTVPHGNIVASLLGAVGNNATGMTGVNWKVGLDLRPTGLKFTNADIWQATHSLTKAGARVINIRTYLINVTGT
ncbi:MAG: hypothetical protein HOP28_01790 [Gemmatimonadales bacterium]|nr:hypothetical protein [Gemmatimonadales bacterium]